MLSDSGRRNIEYGILHSFPYFEQELEAFVAEQLSGREPFYRKAEMTVDGARTPFSSYKLFVEAFMDFAEDDEQKEGLSLPEETSNTPSITPFARKSTPDLSNKNIRAALFDLDGVVLDTERQYDLIWGRIGRQYFPFFSCLIHES